VHVVYEVALVALWAFFVLLWVRFIVDWVMVLSRSWRPTGVAAALLELTYSATDPPLRALRRFMPPLRLGSIALDIGFILLFIVTYALIQVVRSQL
jgi:YggT family protein